jgi:predicted DCC family thiol-disulfide oxidoreductase YuxK
VTEIKGLNTIVLFDGVCNLCNGFVQFVLKHEKAAFIKFASLQSLAGQSLLKDHKIDQVNVDSIVLIHNQKAYIKSSAVLSLLKFMKFPWNVFVFLKIIPPLISDKIYDLVAKYRYRLFGRRESCWLPTPEYKSRFLDEE